MFPLGTSLEAAKAEVPGPDGWPQELHLFPQWEGSF